MQEGIYNEAEKRAKGNSMDVVYNRCMIAEHYFSIIVKKQMYRTVESKKTNVMQ
ncbi:MAG: hypothetical protein WA364_18600 [Candidatus Nitrosopolaris sp.]